MPDSQLNFIYKLDGEVSEVDVFKLAPTLLALGELIQESNRELNPSGRQIGVNVKPFRQGSFIVDFTVFPHTYLQQFLGLAHAESVREIREILELLGLIVGTPVGAVQVIKWLKGRAKAIEPLGPGEVRYTAGDDRSITLKSPVHQLLSNAQITNNIYKVYVNPLEDQPSVTDVRTYIQGEENTAVEVTRDDVPVIKEFVNPSPILANPEETVRETTHKDVYLNPKRGSFDGDAKDWSFRRGDEIVVATIRDKDFLDKCMKGEYRLNHSDLLTVELLERQKVVGTEVMKPTYEITKVTSYVRGALQTRFDL